MTTLEMKQKRVMFIQHSGDYRQEYQRIQAGGEENYYAQKYSMDKVAELGRKVEQIGVLCLCTEQVYDEVVGNGVRTMGGGLTNRHIEVGPALSHIRKFQPTQIILGTPSISDVIGWSFRRGIEVLPVFADSFRISTEGLSRLRSLLRTIRRRYEWHRLASLLNSPRIRWVSNHNINACKDLIRIGVDPRKIVPWDWPPIIRPETFEPKLLPIEARACKLAFVGSLSRSKGLDDAIDAVAALRGRGHNINLTVIGFGDLGAYSRLALEKGVADIVQLEGRQTHRRVLELMRSADLVLVPSHHDYPEGLPMVLYEALATRTPLICSDHPMFVGRISEEAAIMVPEKRPTAIVEAIGRVLNDPDLYRRMSVATLEAWNRIQCPVRWGELIEHLLHAKPEDERWLADHSMTSVENTLC
jgi:glycosyltransferase involved in cell wall biosynthesis